MLGFGFRRKTLRWFVLTVFAASALAGALEASVSGRKSTPMTPGTYQYAISANFKAIPDGPPEPTNAPPDKNVSTNITLTVK